MLIHNHVSCNSKTQHLHQHHADRSSHRFSTGTISYNSNLNCRQHPAALMSHLQRQQPADTPRTTPPPLQRPAYYLQRIHLLQQRQFYPATTPTSATLALTDTSCYPIPSSCSITSRDLTTPSSPSTNPQHTHCTSATTYHQRHTTDTAPSPHTAPVHALHYSATAPGRI